MTRKKKPTIESIQDIFNKKWFFAIQLTPNILINTIVHSKKKYNKTISKLSSIISYLVVN